MQRSSQAGARTSRALFRPAGRDSSGADPVLITPESAGWSFAGLRVVRLAPGASRSLDTGPDEMLVLPLAGSGVVECEGQRYELQGRASVFARISDFAYLAASTRGKLELTLSLA